jgi:hypothetical protein
MHGADGMMLIELGKRLESRRYGRLPEKTAEKAKIAILNFFGDCLAGADAPLTLAEKAVWDSQGCGGKCVIVGGKGKTSPIAAAAVNAVMGQIFLLEDCHENTLSHPVSLLFRLPSRSAKPERRRPERLSRRRGRVRVHRADRRVLITPEFPRFGLRPRQHAGVFRRRGGRGEADA